MHTEMYGINTLNKNACIICMKHLHEFTGARTPHVLVPLLYMVDRKLRVEIMVPSNLLHPYFPAF